MHISFVNKIAPTNEDVESSNPSTNKKSQLQGIESCFN